MKGKIKIWLLFTAIIASVLSCTEKEEFQVELNVEPTLLNFSNEGGEKNIAVFSNTEWSVTKSEGSEWLTLDTDQGSGDRVIVLETQPNVNKEARTAAITFSALGAEPIELIASQFGDEQAGDDKIITFIDEKFKDALLNGYSGDVGHPDYGGHIPQIIDENLDGEISLGEAKAVTQLGLTAREIAAMPELKYFINIERIHCASNFLSSDSELTALDITNCPKLKLINANNNKLNTVDLSKNVALEALYLSQNPLTSLDLSKNKALILADVTMSQLTELDLTNNLKLYGLNIHNTLISEIDLSKNVELITLSIGDAKLTSLDLSANTKLKILGCYNNHLKELYLIENTAISSVTCGIQKDKDGNDQTLKLVMTQEMIDAGVFNKDADANRNVLLMSDDMTLATLPEDGSTIEEDTWIIMDESNKVTKDNFARLRSALQTAGRPISVEFPNLPLLPESALFMGNDASLPNLVSIKAPKVEIIRDWALANCSDLVSVDFPIVKDIRGSALSKCAKLSDVKVPVLVELAHSVFTECTSLKSIDLPNVTEIASSAFSSCTALESISTPKLTTIGQMVFSGCESLETFNAPELAGTTGWVFLNCSSLTTVHMPKGTELGATDFGGCTSLSNLTFATESSVTKVAATAFTTWNGVTVIGNVNLTIGKGNNTKMNGNMWVVPDGEEGTIEIGPFKSITGGDNANVTYSLATIPVDGTLVEGNTWVISDTEAEQADFKNLHTALQSAGRDIALEFPNLIAFPFSALHPGWNSSLENVKSVKAPAAITISTMAFCGCTKMTHLELPAAQTIQQMGLQKLLSITTLSLPEVTIVERMGLTGCSELTTLSLPKIVKLDGMSLSQCPKLNFLTIGTESKVESLDMKFDLIPGNIDVLTGNDNGTTIKDNMWTVPKKDWEGTLTYDEIGPFKSITVK